MGLDISAYRQLKAAPDAELNDDGSPVDWENYLHIRQSIIDYTNQHFPGRTAGVDAGVYAAGDELAFRAGSYGGYNAWRNWLARIAGHVSANAVWAAGITSGPFIELINFSDCEGIIGPQVAAKLAKDFADNQHKITPASDNDQYAILYGKWRAAFEMAADGGRVDFH